MPLTDPQRQVAHDSSRFRVLVAGRRFGKSFLAINEVAKACRYPRKRAFMVYPTYRQAKQVIWDQLKTRLLELNWVEKINESDLSVTLVNGSVISLRGADNPDSLRGVGLDFIVMDEFAMIDEKAWTEVLRPTLSDKQGRAMFITTPLGQSNWAYDLFQKGLDPTESNWSSFQYTTLDGGNVPPEEIEQARQDLDERTFRQEYLATFETYANRIFYSFDRAHNIKTYDDAQPDILYVGMDFNIDPMSMIVFVRKGDDIYVVDEIEMYSSNTQEAVAELQARYPNKRIWVYPDPACRQRKTSAGGATDLTILQNAGFTLKVPNAHNPVRDGVNAVNSKLRSASGHASLFVDPKCRKLIECLEKFSYKQGTSQPDKDSGYDHMADALRYAIDYMFPVRRDIAPQPIQRWGHKI